MMVINCPDYLNEVIDFALKNKCLMALAAQLEYLNQYGQGENICQLYSGSAPHSFAFSMEDANGKRWFNGGLIYSGPTQPLNGSGPAFTVGMGVDNSKHSWSVHT